MFRNEKENKLSNKLVNGRINPAVSKVRLNSL